MENIGQAFITAPGSYMIPASTTTGRTMMVPGVGGTEAMDGKLAHFAHPLGVYNKYTGLWEAPKGWKWNGNMWVPSSRKRTPRSVETAVDKRLTTAKRAKVAMVTAPESDSEDQEAERPGSDDDDTPLPTPLVRKQKTTKHLKATTRQVKSAAEARTVTEKPRSTAQFIGDNRCYACGGPGHFARECPNDDAKRRNDEYLARREQQQKPAGNEKPTP
ncbi:hypothetical protein PHMEG_00035465 [Phytophthora megakarya]|uniref:CCHC-type domain-containing protein n=1 Tax=Phytophthora megakarya TaxID=4795 RepID=A0A225UNN8_9STRA|nr:hypothetical protein PHMEG_00035465 [Phytophthora megakarya]